MTGIVLGDGWLPKQPAMLDDPALPREFNQTDALIAELKDALTALAVGQLTPHPQPNVPQLDLAPLIETLDRPAGLTVQDLRELLNEIPLPTHAPPVDLSVLTQVSAALEKLEFRMRGTGGGGSLSPDITDRAARKLGQVLIATSDTAQGIYKPIHGVDQGDGTVAILVTGSGAAPVPVKDQFSSGEILADQSGAAAVLTFTFSNGPVQLVWVTDTSTQTTAISRADPFGGTPAAGTGIPVLNATPTPIACPSTSTVKVYAPNGTNLVVYGLRY